jgi:hypothetical protein
MTHERQINHEKLVEGWQSNIGLQLDSHAGIVFSNDAFAEQPLSIGRHYGEQSRIVPLGPISNGDWVHVGERLDVVHPIEVGITKLTDGTYKAALFANAVMTSQDWGDHHPEDENHFAYPAASGITQAYVLLSDEELKLLIPSEVMEALELK